MEKTVTTQQCIELVNSQAVAKLHFTKAATTIRVAQIMQAARGVYDGYEAERRRLLEQYGVMDEESGQLATLPDGTIKFKEPAARRAFEAQHRDLLAATTEVAVPRLADLDLEADDMSVAAIFPLLPFVDSTE